MHCNGCGTEEAIRIRAGAGWETCDRCGSIPSVNVPDVYFRQPYLDPNLIDVNDPKQSKGVWIESKRQKAEVMRKLGVRELGDFRHGSRPMDKFAIRSEREKGNVQGKR